MLKDLVLPKVNRANDSLSDALALEKIDPLRLKLAKITTVEEAKQFIGLAAAATAYAKSVKANAETINRATELQLRGERRLGHMIKFMPKAPGERGSGRPKLGGVKITPPKNGIPTLADIGIDKNYAKRARELEKASDSEFEEMMKSMKSSQPILSLNRFVQELKNIRQRDDRDKRRKSASQSIDGIELDKRIIVGDFRKHGDKVPDGSIALIFTDPPYDRETEAVFDGLGKFAADKLAEGGSLLFYLGHIQIHAALDALSKHLRFWWVCACFHDGGPKALMREYGIRVGWKPMFWFVKGTRHDKTKIVCDTVSGDREKDHHPWQQSQNEAEHWIEGLCPPDGIVCDPFLGGGTTAAAAIRLKRQWIAFEKDPVTAAVATKRITQ